MRDVELLVEDFLEDKITLKELTPDELDCVIDELVDIGESMLDTADHDIGVAILDSLEQAIELRIIDPSVGFEEAIVAAEKRGSVYWELDNYSIH